ncbi:AAA family ATPase [Gordonia sp. SCSIO 19800]|uniref:AAA family ATPase n=1 Tax=Gordonia sp. SCSIO 19800 TaxID=2826926 RepID=UPI001B815572|nr:AAA family ATPase [Gordonia sp. SCSIO 19800]MBR7191636.1 AAA family ATPase [Gordonia sp. SCSIO 19800]
MKIRVVDRFDNPPSRYFETLVVLRRDNWDDFGFKTLFDAEVLIPGQESVELGSVKILRAGMDGGPTPFDSPQFTALDERYCSLGQDIEYYEKLLLLPERERAQFLKFMRDAATDLSIVAAFRGEEGWQNSILRFGQAEHTLRAARSLFGGPSPTVGRSGLVHSSSDLQTEVRFDFDDTGPLPGRCKVLIGYNGVGKTRLLAEIARETSKVGNGDPVPSSTPQSTFGAVIAVSYSAFDTFELPLVADKDRASTTSFGYTYCGLRRLENGKASLQLKSIPEIDSELTSAFSLACSRDVHALERALADIDSDPSFGRVGLNLSDWVQVGVIPENIVSRLSAGQKIVANIVVQLAAHLRRRSLVLIDEPETHLHPPLLASLLRGIQRLLEAFDSYLIVATHSPVVLQEVPAKDVQVIERFGGGIRAVGPQLETFGAGLGELTNEAFGLDNSVSDYRAVIRELAQGMSIDAIEELFPLGMASQARALAMRAMRREGQ